MPTRWHRAVGDTRTTAQRGYSTATHGRIRKQYATQVAAGMAECTEPICLMPTRHITPGEPWDLAHNRAEGGYHGPAHARCNRSEGATYFNTQARRGWRTPRTRNW